jgi:prepilin-type processing-associated H-X9-DG protein
MDLDGQSPVQFSLRDLFVAVAVIALLIMFVPRMMVDGVRTGRSNPCRNNLKNLALALIQYEVSKNQYPGYNNDLDPSTIGTPNNDRSWTFVILPYMDHRGLFDKLRNSQVPSQYDAQGNVASKNAAVPPKLHVTGYTTYVVNTGQLDAPATALRPADFPENGVFHTGVRSTPDERLAVMSSQYVAAGDGLGTTLLMAENADARSWTDTAERWTGFTWHAADGQPGAPTAYPIDPLGLNVMSGQSKNRARQSTAAGYARPSSHHPDGVNVAFCDGHVRFISDQISYRVYQAMMTPRGAGAVDNSNPLAVRLPVGHAATLRVNEDDIR